MDLQLPFRRPPRSWGKDSAIGNITISNVEGFIFSLHELRRCRGRFVRSLPCYLGRVRLLPRTHHRLQPPAFPTTSRPRLAGTAMEISRFPCKRLLRMPGSTTTRGRRVSCDIDTSRVAFCGTENISTPNLSYAAQYLACAFPCERFTSFLADNPCITRGQCGSLLLHCDGLPPSTSCRSPGAPVHSINKRHEGRCDPARYSGVAPLRIMRSVPSSVRRLGL